MKTTEQIIEDVGLKVPEVQSIPLEKIEHSVERSQTRETTYNEDALETYVNWIEMGSPTPPIIAMKNGRDLFEVLAGDHRVESNRRAGSKTLLAFVLQGATPAQAAEIRYRSNTGHGLYLGQRERLEAGVHLVREMGRNTADVARELGIKPSTLKQRIDEEQATDDLAAAGVDPTLIPPASRIKLRPLRTDHAVLRKAAELTHQAQLSTADVGRLVKKVRQQTSEDGRLSVVEAEAERLQPEIAAALAGAKKRPAFRILTRALDQITSLDLDELLTELAPNPELAYQIGAATAVLTEVLEAITPTDAEAT